jgi:replicative DNA helicase
MISVSKITDLSKATTVEFSTLEDLTKFVCSSDWAHSTFKNGHRASTNFLSTRLLVLDIDNTDENETCSLEQAKELFKDYLSIITTTKSHQVLKGNRIADRFRVILFTKEPITDPNVYAATWKSLYNKYKFVDRACSDNSRLWYSSKELISINKGEYYPVTKVEVEPNLVSYSGEEVNGIRGLETVDFHKMTRGTPKCLYALSHGIFISGIGERSHIFLKLAAYYRNIGYSKEVNYNILKGISRLNYRLYPENEQFSKDELWVNIIEPLYKENPNFKYIKNATGVDIENEIIKRYCDSISKVYAVPCCLHGKKEESALITTDEIATKFQSYAKDYDKNLIKTGLNSLDPYFSMSVGTVNILAASCGVGKSSWALNVLANAGTQDINSIFFSMDMPSFITFSKMALLVTNYTKEQIFEAYKSNNRKVIEEIKNKIKEVFNKTTFDFSSTLSLEDIKQRVYENQQKIGNKVSLCVVDYFSRLSSPYGDEYASVNFNALKSVEVATETEACFLYLSQVARNFGDGSTPIKSSRTSRGSGMIEEAASNVLTAYRPLMNTEHDNYTKIFIAKNRLGENKEITLGWNGAKGAFFDLNKEELDYFETELAPIVEERIKPKFNV